MQFADAFGWTPKQVDDEVPAWLEPLIMPILGLLGGEPDGSG